MPPAMWRGMMWRVSDPMTDVLDAFAALEAAQARADEIVAAARLEFGRAMYEARNLPPHLGRIQRSDIEKRIDGKLKYERLRQIEMLYADTLKVA